MDKTHKLYWIYDKRIHTDPMTEGYIGVTTYKYLSQRLGAHRNTEVANNESKHNTRHMYYILKDIPYEHTGCKLLLTSTSEQEILRAEENYRPTSDIGWNRYPGGKRTGKQRPFIITKPDGTEKVYKSLSEARKDGYNPGNLSSHLRGLPKYPRVAGGCTARYID